MSHKEELKISIIIPVFNRPKEIEELLESLRNQTEKGFEVIVVEDGSDQSSESIVEAFQQELDIKYFFKENSGPGLSRNFGCEKATGNYCIFLDSDCVLPPDYFKTVQNALERSFSDAFGGPDRAHRGFTKFQKAINFSMTSFLTTGGIRGGSENLDKFHPRSFNMGFSGDVFKASKGFSNLRFGEDIDLSIRIMKLGFKTRLIKEAFVYHKRRTNLRRFFKQVYNSGIARINIYKRHPDSLKMVHFAPALFSLGTLLLMLLSLLFSAYFLAPVLLHLFLLLLSSTIKNRSFIIGVLSILTSYTQLFAYGFGFMVAFWNRLILGRDEFSAFNKNFYN